MKPVWRGIALGAGAYLLFLIVNVPAAWVAARIGGVMPQVQLSGIDGSLWSGRADQLRFDPVILEQVQWRWHPFALALGRLEYRVEGRWGDNPVAMSAGASLFGGAYLRDVSATGPVQSWAAALALPVEASGDLSLALDQVRFAKPGGAPILRGAARWTSATVTGPVALDLGQVNLDLAPDGDVTHGTVKAQDGALLVDGTVDLDASGQYNLQVDMTPTDKLADDVRGGLAAIAEEHNGRYHLIWNGAVK